MELAEHLIEKGKELAEQFIAEKIELPALIDSQLDMWLALPEDKKILAFGAFRIKQNDDLVIFKIGVQQL